SRTAGKRRPNRRGRPSGRREVDRGAAVGGRGPWRGLTRAGGRFGGGRLAGGNEAEGGDQCDEQGGADQRRVPHISSPAKRRTRPWWWCTAISAAKGQEQPSPRETRKRRAFPAIVFPRGQGGESPGKRWGWGAAEARLARRRPVLVRGGAGGVGGRAGG